MTMEKKKRQQFIASVLMDLGMDEEVIETITGLTPKDLQQK